LLQLTKLTALVLGPGGGDVELRPLEEAFAEVAQVDQDHHVGLQVLERPAGGVEHALVGLPLVVLLGELVPLLPRERDGDFWRV
jgi:hypothetical protein